MYFFRSLISSALHAALLCLHNLFLFACRVASAKKSSPSSGASEKSISLSFMALIFAQSVLDCFLMEIMRIVSCLCRDHPGEGKAVYPLLLRERTHQQTFKKYLNVDGIGISDFHHKAASQQTLQIIITVKHPAGKELLKLNFQWNAYCQTRT